MILYVAHGFRGPAVLPPQRGLPLLRGRQTRSRWWFAAVVRTTVAGAAAL